MNLSQQQVLLDLERLYRKVIKESEFSLALKIKDLQSKILNALGNKKIEDFNEQELQFLIQQLEEQVNC